MRAHTPADVIVAALLALGVGAGSVRDASGSIEAVANVQTHVAAASSRQARSYVVRGDATYYCCTVHHAAIERVAAAGPRLRRALGPHWRGRWVTVRAGSRAVRVRLIDWCGCPSGRVIDLHPGPFGRLAPLSRGVVRVVITA